MRKRDVKTSLVAFVDILGFANKTLSIKTYADMREVEKQLKTVQQEFLSDAADKWDALDVKITGREVLAFSDCIVHSVPLASDLTELQGTFDSLMMELDRIAIAQATAVLKGIFLRGGIDIGPWFKRDDLLISPAHVNAYHLEQAVCYPVIAVSDKTFAHFSSHHDRKYYEEGTDGVDFFFGSFKRSGKTIRYLDYMAILLADAEDESEAFLWLRAHKAAIETAMQDVTSPKVLRKYQWLVHYHNRHIRRRGKGFKSLKIL